MPRLPTANSKLAAKDLQRLVRAEEAVAASHIRAVVNGKMADVWSPVGYCVCRTCGKVRPWEGWNIACMQGGHYLAKCQHSPAYLEELNVHPQCVGCNEHSSGASDAYDLYMRSEYGQDVIDWLRYSKNKLLIRECLNDTQLIMIRIGFRNRIARAEGMLEDMGISTKSYPE